MNISINDINFNQLPLVHLANKCSLPTEQGIYFVFSGKVLLYIGKAQNIKNRWVSHHRFTQFQQFKNVVIRWIPSDEIDKTELVLIEHFEPLLNDTPVPQPARLETISKQLQEAKKQLLKVSNEVNEKQQETFVKFGKIAECVKSLMQVASLHHINTKDSNDLWYSISMKLAEAGSIERYEDEDSDTLSKLADKWIDGLRKTSETIQKSSAPTRTDTTRKMLVDSFNLLITEVQEMGELINWKVKDQ